MFNPLPELRADFRSALANDRPAWLNPSWGLALRSTVSLGVPLLLAAFGYLPINVTFVAIAAHGMSLLDIKGPYALRLGFLLTMSLLMAGACALGIALRDWPLLGILGAGLLACNAGLWRHLTPDYGNYLSIPVGLQFFMALTMSADRLYELPHGLTHAAHPYGPAVASIIGAGWGTLVHMALWPVRPQHPLRRAIADSWVKAGDLFAALSSFKEPATLESDFRRAYDNTDQTLAAGAVRRALPEGLTNTARLSARLVTRVSALHAAYDAQVGVGAAGGSGRGGGVGGGVTGGAGIAEAGAMASAYAAALGSLANTAEAVALATVSQQPAHLAIVAVRVKRAEALLEALVLASGGAEAMSHVVSLLVAELHAASRAVEAATVRAGERGVIPLELFDLRTWKLHPLAALLNLRATVDPMISRFTARLAVMLMAGTAFLEFLFHRSIYLPHPYWLPFTMLIVAQTDYGATRQRAAQRLVGTLIGSVLASGLLYLRLPHGVVFALVFITCFAAGYSLRRKYAVSVVFITLMVVTLTEMSHPTTVELTLERMGLTALGGLSALIATLLFWPAWERDRHSAIAAGALGSTYAYLQIVLARLQHGGLYGPGEIAAKQAAERASALALASLGRMYAEPKNQRAGLERAAVLANGNARLIRIVNLLLIHSADTPTLSVETAAFIAALLSDLGQLAADVAPLVTADVLTTIPTTRTEVTIVASTVNKGETSTASPGSASPTGSLSPLLLQSRTELDAMMAANRLASLKASARG